MDRFLEILERPAGLTADDRPTLEGVAARYPWFDVPKGLLLRLALRSGDTAAADRWRRALSLGLSGGPVPGWMLDGAGGELFRSHAPRALVDRFLTLEDKRIVPCSDRPEEGEADLSDQARQAAAEGPVSETLARVYAAQGLTEQAAEIYRRLSLTFPEKSVYFAHAIEQLKSER